MNSCKKYRKSYASFITDKKQIFTDEIPYFCNPINTNCPKVAFLAVYNLFDAVLTAIEKVIY